MFALLALTVVGCSDQTTRRDASVDGPTVQFDLSRDLGRDGVADSAADAAVDLTPDLSPDAAPDAPPPDVQGWDTLPSRATALYTVTKNTAAFSLRSVLTDSSGSPTLVSGWKGPLSLESVRLAGFNEAVPVNVDRPRPLRQMPSGFEGVALPGVLGTLLLYHDQSSGMTGLAAVRPTGALVKVLEVAGVYSDTLSTTLALSDDGTVGAVVVDKKAVRLFRTDGKTFASGKTWTDVTPTTAKLKTLDPTSLFVVGSYLLCRATDATGTDHLYRGPLDGASVLTELTLPQSGGKAPKVVAAGAVANEKKTHALVAAGELATVQDLYLITLASGTVVKVTANPGYLGVRGEGFGSYGGQLALSPSATRLAFTRWVNGVPELFVSDAKAGATPLEVSGDRRMKSTVTVHYNLHFADDNHLHFSAGQGASSLDLFHWDHGKATLTNLTGTGGTRQPFDGVGDLTPRGGWVSPNGKWVYFAFYDSSARATDMVGVDRTTQSVVPITSGLDVASEAGLFAACPGKGELYFVAATNMVHQRREVWRMDQNAGTKATRVTFMTAGFGGAWSVGALTMDRACKSLAWTAGSRYPLHEVWTTAVGALRKEQKLSKLPRFIAPSLRFTPDGKSLVYASGGSSPTTVLRAVPVTGGPEQILDSAAGIVHLFAVY